jgi:phage tail sheath gpL-like
MKKTGAIIGATLLFAGCGGPDNGKLTEAEARGSKEAAESGRIECALEGAKLFDRTCTVEEMTSADGTVLIVGKADVGYRRLQITTDGRGVVSADGALPAKVTIVDDGVIEVAIGKDRYRLPANTGGAK